MPVYFKVGTPDGRSTREPLPQEIPLIKSVHAAVHRRAWRRLIGLWDVPGVGDVSFAQMDGNGKGQSRASVQERSLDGVQDR